MEVKVPSTCHSERSPAPYGYRAQRGICFSRSLQQKQILRRFAPQNDRVGGDFYIRS